MCGHTMFPEGKTGSSLKEKNSSQKKVFISNQSPIFQLSSLKSSVLLKKTDLHFESVSDFMVLVPKISRSLYKEDLNFQSVLDFWQTGRNKTLKIETVPPKLGRMVSLTM